MSLAAQQSLESHYVMHTFGRSPVEFVEGHGMKLTGDDGREYLDFLAGIGVCSLGHGNLAVLSALEAQTKKLMHVSNYFYIEQRGQVAALLSKLANDDVDGARVLADAVVAGDETTAAALGAPAADEQVWETFFANSGAEANEGSMKLARLYAKRAGNGGNTIACMRPHRVHARRLPRPYARDHCRHHAGLAAGQLPPAAGWLCGLHAQRCGRVACDL